VESVCDDGAKNRTLSVPDFLTDHPTTQYRVESACGRWYARAPISNNTLQG
jgi:hypothetical protein